MFGRKTTKEGGKAPAASESTPLTTTTAAGTEINDAAVKAAAEAAGAKVSEMASKLMTSENLKQVSEVAAARVKEISEKVIKGDMSIRLMALIGGIAISFFACSGILGDLFGFRWGLAVMEVYTLFFGLLMILLESHVIKDSAKYTDILYKYCLFLKYIWGRGILYFIAGNLQFAQGGIINFCVGGWVMFVGILYVLVGRHSAQKLSQLKHNIYSEGHLKKAFEKADTNKDGFINLEEFGKLCDELDLDLTKREKEAIFFHLDTSDDDLLTFDEFKQWWDNFDASLATV